MTAGSEKRSMELLAPAGDRAALEAALDAGANAVYFGMTALNARRRAKNFRQNEFAEAVELVHQRGAKAYLTLNIDLAEREVGQAARMLEWARRCGTDAVLIRDPALMALKTHFPDLPFHFSTQTCATSSADVAAAESLGATRIVLAREMTAAEIRAASAAGRVETEVFVQGALCYCVSGRCLLSSWIGGRSGNRGTCTSPCRVPWTIEGRPAQSPLSMRDLSAVERLEKLESAGVAALKIEGRLKTADWVRRAVSLYRNALDGQTVEPDASLGDYTGRALTCGYLKGDRTELTGAAGRESAADLEPEGMIESEPAPQPEPTEDDDENYFDLDVDVSGRAIEVRFACMGREVRWSIPKTVVHRPKKAISLGQFFEWLESRTIVGKQLGRGTVSDPDFLIVPRASNALADRVDTEIRRALKPVDDLVRVEVPDALRAELEHKKPSGENRLALGSDPDRARIEARNARAFLNDVKPRAVIVEGAVASQLDKLLSACGKTELVVALPSVFFEADIRSIERLLDACREAKVAVEANNWGGWHLARRTGVRMEAGPGLAVLNSLAARELASLGMACVTYSPEADRRRLEDLSAACPAPASLVVFGRPPLLTTRVEIDRELEGKPYEDRRGAKIVPRRENGLWVFRPLTPFDLRGEQNDSIRAAHLVVDLVGSEDPTADWFNIPTEDDHPFRFNYDRTLS